MQTYSKLKYARISAQKTRLVADQIRGMKVGQAFALLKFNLKKAAKIIEKVLHAAVSNAEHNFGLDIDELRISEIMVDQGPVLKRIRARAKGRACGIKKQTCHITLVVSDS